MELAELLLQGMKRFELLVPAALQIRGNESIFRVHGVILTACPCGLEARLFDRVFELLDLVQFLSPQVLHRSYRSFDSKRLDSIKHLTGDCAINPHSSETDTTHFRSFAESPTTGVALREGLDAAVRYLQLPAASGAPE